MHILFFDLPLDVFFFFLYPNFMPDLLLCKNTKDLDLHSALTSTREIYYDFQNLLIFFYLLQPSR